MNMKRVVLWGLVFCLVWAGCGVAGETGGCEISVPEDFNVSASRAAFDGVWDKAVAEAETQEKKNDSNWFRERFNELSEIGKKQTLYLYSLPRVKSDKRIYTDEFDDFTPVKIFHLKETLERYIQSGAIRQIIDEGSPMLYGDADILDEFENEANTGKGGDFVVQLARCFDELWTNALAKAKQVADVKTYNLLIDKRWFKYRESIYKGFMDYGKHVNEFNKGVTPLMEACYVYDDATLVKALLEAGANPNLGTAGEEKRTALTYAIQQKHPKAVAALIKGGANIEQKDERGRTAINWAGNLDNVDVVATLIKAGAKVDTRDNEGRTAMMHAAYEGYASVVELLLKSGANPNLETTGKYKYTALTFAAEQGQIQIFPIFERYGIGREKILEAKIFAIKSTKRLIESLKQLLMLNALLPNDKAKEFNQNKGDLKKAEDVLKKLQDLYCSDPKLSKLDVCKCQ